MKESISKKTYILMGGEFQFLAFPQSHLSNQEVQQIFDEAYLEVKRIEEKYTDFKDSYFGRINLNAGLKAVDVDDETIWLIKKSQEISNLSNGIFDISFASIGHNWRLKKENGEILSESFIRSHLKYVNYKLIEIDEKNKTVFLPFQEMKIGLGGIGKGYAVDSVYNFFLKKGLYNFYINGSGDIRVHALASAPRAWRIGIRNPLSRDPQKAVGVVQIYNGSIASSGGYVHNVNGDRFNNHIINPKTGMSAREIIGSTVCAGDALVADTTATILMNLSKKEALCYMNDHNLFGVIFCKDGKSHLSEKAFKNFGLNVEGSKR